MSTENEYTVTMADVCELAHELTVTECERLKIEVDAEQENGDIRYTEEAQDVFNKYCDLVTNSLGV